MAGSILFLQKKGAAIMTAPDTIIPLDPSGRAQAAEIICQAFKNDPAGVYAAPDPTRRSISFPGMPAPV